MEERNRKFKQNSYETFFSHLTFLMFTFFINWLGVGERVKILFVYLHFE